MARTRPSRSPSQPNSTPPVAAPIRNDAVAIPNQKPTAADRSAGAMPDGRRSVIAGPATSGNRPISRPSNIQPSRAAVRAIHCPRLTPVSADFAMSFMGNRSQRAGVGEPERKRPEGLQSLALSPVAYAPGSPGGLTAQQGVKQERGADGEDGQADADDHAEHQHVLAARRGRHRRGRQK